MEEIQGGPCGSVGLRAGMHSGRRGTSANRTKGPPVAGVPFELEQRRLIRTVSIVGSLFSAV